MALLSKVKKNEVRANLEDFVILLRGLEKSGKSSFYAELVREAYGTPDAGLLIPFETGYKALQGINIFPYTITPKTIVDGEEYRGWSLFTDLVDELVETASTNGIKLIGIDTIDRFYDVAIEETLRQSRLQTHKPCKSLNEAFGGYGRGKEYLFGIVKEQLQRLRTAGYGLVIIGHVKFKTIKDKIYQEEYQIVGSNLNEDMDKVIANDSDFILMISEEKSIKDGLVVGSERFLRLRSDGFYNCGSRFKDVPEKIELSAKKFIDTFRKAVLSAGGYKEEEIGKISEQQHKERVKEAEIVQELSTDAHDKIVNKLKDYLMNSTEKEKSDFIKEVTTRKINLKEPKSNSLEALTELAELYNLA